MIHDQTIKTTVFQWSLFYYGLFWNVVCNSVFCLGDPHQIVPTHKSWVMQIPVKFVVDAVVLGLIAQAVSFWTASELSHACVRSMGR